MVSFKPIHAAVAIAMAAIDHTTSTNVAAFVSPEFIRAKTGEGKIAMDGSGPPEYSPHSSLFQTRPQKTRSRQQSKRKSPRMSEASFRLDYIQGMRQSYNKAPVSDPLEEKSEEVKSEVFVYGSDSTCYRGLTKPSKAGLTLAIILAFGMVIASPDIHLSVPSLPLFLEGAQHLVGDNLASALGAIVERTSFHWDMSGLPRSFHELSDQLVPFVAQQRDQWQDTLAALPSRFDGLSVQVASQTDVLKDELVAKLGSVETSLGEAFISGKAAVAHHTGDWQAASHAKIDQWQNDLAQASGRLQGELAQGYANIRYAGQAKIDQIQQGFHQDYSQLQVKGDEVIARAKDVVLMKASEFQETIQQSTDQIKDGAVEMNEQARVLANDYSAEMKDLSQQSYGAFREVGEAKMMHAREGLLSEMAKVRETMEIVVAQKFTDFQQLSKSTMDGLGKDAIQLTESVRTMFANVGADLEATRREIGSTTAPMIQGTGEFLRDKTAAFRDTSWIEWDDVQHRMGLQGDAAADAIGDNLQKWQENTANGLSALHDSVAKQVAPMDTIGDNINKFKESTTNQISSFESSVANQASSIVRRDNSLTTESAFLKAMLEEMVY